MHEICNRLWLHCLWSSSKVIFTKNGKLAVYISAPTPINAILIEAGEIDCSSILELLEGKKIPQSRQYRTAGNTPSSGVTGLGGQMRRETGFIQWRP